MINLAVFALALCAAHGQLYDSLKTEVTPLNQVNWMNQVSKSRNNDNIIIVHFFKGKDSESVAFAKEFTAKAEEYKGVFIFGFVDCEKQAALCKKENVSGNSSVKLYPPLPMPVEDFPLDIKRIISRSSSFLKFYVTEVTEDNAPGFLGTDPTLPKVMFFTESPQGIPLVVKALSRNFNKKLSFGIVRKGTTDLERTYGIKKFPSVVVIKNNQKRPNVYDKEMNYKAIFDFLNFFSEQFATVDKDKPSDSKPWLFEAIPELSKKSASDVCLAHEKVLCVILFLKDKPDKDQIETLKKLRAEFNNELDKGASFKFMWINGEKNEKWVSDLSVGSLEKPSVRVLNPGKRKRYTSLESDFSFESVSALLERINGGDARFTQLRGEVPEFSSEL